MTRFAPFAMLFVAAAASQTGRYPACQNYTVVPGDTCDRVATIFQTDYAHVTQNGAPCEKILALGVILLACPKIPAPAGAASCTGSSSSLEDSQCDAIQDFLVKTGTAHGCGIGDPCACKPDHGLHVQCSGKSVTRITLAGTKLTGSISESVGKLTDLEEFGVSFNELTGTVPTSLAQLTKLTGLTAVCNKLGGALPAMNYSKITECGLSSYNCDQGGYSTNTFTCPLPPSAYYHCHAVCK